MRADAALFQLLRLASPGLPIGGYCYSQGLESAIELGYVTVAAEAGRWLGDLLAGPLAHFDAPFVAAAFRAFENGEAAAVAELNAVYLASRETGEQRLETLQMGYSLRRLLDSLPEGQAVAWPAALAEGVCFPVAWAVAAVSLKLGERASVAAFLFGWLENQLLVLMKALPLGHTAAQQLLSALIGDLEAAADTAVSLPIDAWSNFAPLAGHAAMRHETQYSRLFRS